jgi:hypothetical protein
MSRVLSSQASNDKEAMLVLAADLLKKRDWAMLLDLLLRRDSIEAIPLKARESLARLASTDDVGVAFTVLIWISNSIIQSLTDSNSCDGLTFSLILDILERFPEYVITYLELNGDSMADKIGYIYSSIIESSSPISPDARQRVDNFVAEFCILIDNPQIHSALIPETASAEQELPRELKSLVDLQQVFLTHIPSLYLLPASMESLDELCKVKMKIDWTKALERQAVIALEAGDLDRSEALFARLGRCSTKKDDRKRIEIARLLDGIKSARRSIVLPVAELAGLLKGVCRFFADEIRILS